MPFPNPFSYLAGRVRSLTGRGRATGAAGDPDEDGVDPDEDDRRRRRAELRFDGSRRMLVPHEQQFAGRYGVGGSYWSRFDEALRDNWQNGLAMRHSSFIEDILSHRIMPVVSLAWHVEVDDPKDPEQSEIAGRLTKLVEAIPRLPMLRYYLAECIWKGKAGAQVSWGEVMVDGRPGVTIVDHEPVDGDSIVYRYDKTPGVLVRSDWGAGVHPHDRRHVRAPDKSWLQPADRAMALFLYDPYWRDHFIINNFIPSSADYLFEGDQAAGLFGVGYRSKLYWDFQLRDELRTWRNDALERVGVNGMIYGFYQSGNDDSKLRVLEALGLLVRDNVTAFPVEPGMPPQEVRNIEPAQVGYDVIQVCVKDLEDSMRQAVLGQSLTSEAQGGGGLGNEAAAELHRSTFEYRIRFDAANQFETLTGQMLRPMIRMNTWTYRGKVYRGVDLPFRARLIGSIDKANVKERSEVIFGAYDRGMELDKEESYADLGLTQPKDPANILKKPEPEPPVLGAAPGGNGEIPGASPGGTNGAVRPQGPPVRLRKTPAGKLAIVRANGVAKPSAPAPIPTPPTAPPRSRR